MCFKCHQFSSWNSSKASYRYSLFIDNKLNLAGTFEEYSFKFPNYFTTREELIAKNEVKT